MRPETYAMPFFGQRQAVTSSFRGCRPLSCLPSRSLSNECPFPFLSTAPKNLKNLVKTNIGVIIAVSLMRKLHGKSSLIGWPVLRIPTGFVHRVLFQDKAYA